VVSVEEIGAVRGKEGGGKEFEKEGREKRRKQIERK
jgi:hypothetical protein